MVITACTCNWDIPGIESLPAHSHRAWARVVHNGREITMLQHDLDLNPALRVLDQGEDINVWVDWRELAHA